MTSESNVTNTMSTMNANAIERIKVKETKKFYGDLEGPFDSIITSLKLDEADGWEGLELKEEYDYGDCHPKERYYLYRHREETDKEHERRAKELEKHKERELEEKARKKQLSDLKKKLKGLSKEELKLLGLSR